MNDGKRSDPRDIDDERRGRTIQKFARDHGVSPSLIKRAISWGRLTVRYYGDRPIIGPEEHERVCREGLPDVPAGYNRKTPGPAHGGRPRSKKAAKAAGKPAKAPISRDPRRTRDSDRRAAPID